ncbi:hypothetical protein [Symbioplanes lichenis]|uniref:hypothetical protein n=1 Tax=Symbioplanes lichenis TaxID=1629072 RepID=UPI0027395272|nr:hypothetical protein [Actinoplanes lichenis]
MTHAWFADTSAVVIDAVVARDKDALDALDDLVRRVHRAVLVALGELAPDGDRESLRACERWTQLTANYVRSALDRIAPSVTAARIRGGAAARFLEIVDARPGINSRTIGESINRAGPGAAKPMDEGQLSRLGNGLRAQGLVLAERVHHGLAWELTPLGEEVLGHLQRTAASPRTGLVVTTAGVDRAELLRLVERDPPRLLTVMRRRDSVVYRRMGGSEGPADGKIDPVEHVASDLFDDYAAEPPRYFRSGSCHYERVASPPEEHL